MKMYGHLDLNFNMLKNFILPTDTNFPANSSPGMIIFKDKKLYLCAEIESSLPVWIPLTPELNTYIHTQSTASTAWTIAHNLNSSNVLVQVVDANGMILIPDYIDTGTYNQVTVSFSTAQAGRAVLMLGNLNGANRDVLAYTQSYVSETVWVVSHGLGYYPEISAYVGNKMVQPQSITHDSVNQATITFSSAQTGYVRCI